MKAKKIISLLKEKGISKWKISKMVNVSWQSVYMWEKEVFSPNKENKALLNKMLKEVSNDM